MEIKKRAEPSSIAEICLPLFLFAGAQIFYAVFAIAWTIPVTFFLLELLRRPFGKNDLAGFYLFWLALIGSAGWMLFGLQPYWVWSVYLFVPTAVWAPSPAARGKPSLYALKKNSRDPAGIIIRALFILFLFAVFLYGLSFLFKKTIAWMIVFLALILFEIMISKIKRQKA